MAKREMRECRACGTVKDLEVEFGKHPNCRDGRQPVCKDCRKSRQAERVRKKKRRYKKISEDNKNFFRLGLSKGLDHCQDLEKAIVILERANRAILKVLKDADIRDDKSRQAHLVL